MSAKILLGTIKNDSGNNLAGKVIYLTKHTWECSWYWGFGYIGNSHNHCHFDSTFLKDHKTASELFDNTYFTDNDWWIVRDLFIQAYALKMASEVYRHGGHQTRKAGITDVIKNKNMEDALSADLKEVLDTLWNFIEDCKKNKSKQREELAKKKEELDKLKKKKEDVDEEHSAIVGKIKQLEEFLED